MARMNGVLMVLVVYMPVLPVWYRSPNQSNNLRPKCPLNSISHSHTNIPTTFNAHSLASHHYLRIYVQLSPWRGWSTHNNHFRGFSRKTFGGFSGAAFGRFSPGGCASGFRQHTEPRSEVQTTISREREKAFTAQKLWVYFDSSFSSHCLHSGWRYMAPLNANELGWTNKFLATLQFIKIRGFLSKFLFRVFFWICFGWKRVVYTVVHRGLETPWQTELKRERTIIILAHTQATLSCERCLRVFQRHRTVPCRANFWGIFGSARRGFLARTGGTRPP